MKLIILSALLLIGLGGQSFAADAKEVLKASNKKLLVSFLKSSQADNFRTFYDDNLQFTQRTSYEKFAQKFADYKDLPNDIAAIEQQDFETHDVTELAGKSGYCAAKLLQAKSLMKVQVVQDAHKYTITTKFCPTSGDYKLVSFKIGYMEN